MAANCCESQCSSDTSSTEGPGIQPLMSPSFPPDGSAGRKHIRGDSTVSAVSAGGVSPFHPLQHRAMAANTTAPAPPPAAAVTTSKISAPTAGPKRGHKRAQSAGNYGFGAKDLSIYMVTGLYAHQMAAYRSFEYGFKAISSSAAGLSNSDSNLSSSCREATVPSVTSSKSKRHRSYSHNRAHRNHQLLIQKRHQSQSQAGATLDPVQQLLPPAATVAAVLSSSNQVKGKSNDSRTYPDDNSDDEYEYYSDGDSLKTSCGIMSFRPDSLQKYATIQVFVLLCCILVTLNQALSSGYFNSVITTIEKRFDIPSRMTGLIASTFEIGNLITVIFVSYFGTHRHIPKWIGKGIIVTGLGSLVFSLAHFMPQSNPLDKVNMTGLLDDNICHIPEPLIHSPVAERASHFLVPEGGDQPVCGDSGSYQSPHLVIFVLAMILIGCGGTPIFTLGTIYIDDHVRQENSSMYIGCMYSMVAFGLVVGFLLGGYFITIHENSFGTGIIPADIYPGHPKWIGAWWCGFVLLGILLILIAVPFFAFPQSLKRKRRKKPKDASFKAAQIESDQMASSSNGKLMPTGPCSNLIAASNMHEACTSLTIDLKPNKSIESSQQNPSSPATYVMTGGLTTATELRDEHPSSCSPSPLLVATTVEISSDDQEYGRSIKEIPKCMWNLLSNPVFIVTCLGSCMELSIVSGFLVFIPKYLETQFTISKSEANLFAGGIAVPGACFGIFLGGFLLKKFQLGIKGAIQFVLFFNLVCMGLYTGLYFLGCHNMRMAGTTLPYYNSSSFEVPFQVNLTAECNNRCRCPPNEIEPICGRNGITYFSPCHAGCQTAGGPRHTQNYSDCACITETYPNIYTKETIDGVTAVPIAIAGPCPQKCQAMIPFLVILFVVTLVVSITQMPLVMITLRSVREEERAFALGMQFVIFRLFGYIPSPIVFGNVIDSTCLYWKANCGRQGGFCLIYNIEQFRLRYIGVCSGLKVAAGLLFFLDWILVSYSSSQDKKSMIDKPLDVGVKQIVRSIVSLDKISGHAAAAGDQVDRLELLETGPDSDYNSAIDDEEDEESSGMITKNQSCQC